MLAANRALWGIELHGGEEWHFTHYSAEVSAACQAHVYCSLEDGTASCRKLSVTVNLTDPRSSEAGPPQLGAVTAPDAGTLRQRGAAIVFPGFLESNVTPLLAGERFSLVPWLSGPNWR